MMCIHTHYFTGSNDLPQDLSHFSANLTTLPDLYAKYSSIYHEIVMLGHHITLQK